MVKIDEIKESPKIKIMNEPAIFDSILKDSLLTALRTIIKINIDDFEESKKIREKLNQEQTLAFLFKCRQKLVYSKDKLGLKSIKMINQG